MVGLGDVSVPSLLTHSGIGHLSWLYTICDLDLPILLHTTNERSCRSPRATMAGLISRASPSKT